MRRVIRNQIEEERASSERAKRQRMAQMRAEEARRQQNNVQSDLWMHGWEHGDRVLQL